MAARDPSQMLLQQHTPEAIAQRLQLATSHGYLGDFVLGAIDGTVTTFAIVAGVAGAELSTTVAMVLGLANVLADGFSMAVSNYLKATADHHVVERYRRVEESHIDEFPEGEREEIRQIFANKGFSGEILERVVTVITDDRRRWVDTMLTEELGLPLTPPQPMRAALTTFAAFVLAGLIPLAPLAFSSLLTAQQTFAISAAAAAGSFFVIGLIRGKVTGRRMWRAGLETLLMGGGAALLSYGVGAALKQLVD
jgi:VIT1/CCC1 family predicted Fe2+/Mn2+ transporter